MSYKNIPFGTVEKFNVVVEISKGSANKYEYDETLDAIKLEWVFSGGFHFPYDYGYIPETRGGDGDHLDVFIFSAYPIALGTIVKCRAIGMIELFDRGEEDNKILAIPLADPQYKNYKELTDLTFDYKTIFEKFFKELEVQKDKVIEIKGFRNRLTTLKELDSAHQKYQ